MGSYGGKYGKLCLFYSLLLLFVSQIAFAQSNTLLSYNIPRGKLSTALITFSRQSGFVVVAPAEYTANKTVLGLTGAYRTQAALSLLLRGSGLTYHFEDDRTLVIKPRVVMGENVTQPDSATKEEPPQKTTVDLRSARKEVAKLEEIIVTSQKREESLQDAPISITAFSRNDIRRKGIQGVQDYAYVTPSLSISEGQNASDVNVSIRGIGNLGGEQNLFGLYLDGFELSAGSNRTFGMPLLDLDRIEVLRGPQGTTFGRNNVSGAINLVSAEPQYYLGGESSLSYGSFGEVSTQHILNIPVIKDTLAIRFAGQYSRGEGFLQNIGPAGDTNDHETYTLRTSVLFEPSDKLHLQVSVFYDDQKYGADGRVTDGQLIGNVLILQEIIDDGEGGVPPGTLPAGPDELFPNQNRIISTNTTGFQHIENTVVTANMSYDIADGDMSLVTVAGYIDSALVSQQDNDQSEFDSIIENFIAEGSFESIEVRLQSNAWKKINWIGGVYYSKTKDYGSFQVTTGEDIEALTMLPPSYTGLAEPAPLLLNNTFIIGRDYEDYLESYAVFGEVSYNLTGKLKLTAGARYSKDTVFNSIFNGVDVVDADVTPLLEVVEIPDTEDIAKFDKATWRFNALYTMSNDVNLYAAISTGYRTGGIQLRNTAKTDYDPDSIVNYEFGLKAMWLDGRLRSNFALYRMDWGNVQINTQNRSNNQTFTDNAGKAYVQGFELDLAANLTRKLSFDAGVSLVDSEIAEYIDSTGLDRSGIVMPNTPKFSSSLSVQYAQPLSRFLSGFFRATHMHVGKRLEGVVDGKTDLQFIGAFDRIDIRVGIETANWRLEGYVENLFDSIYATGIDANGFSATGSSVSSFPRRMGVRFHITY